MLVTGRTREFLDWSWDFAIAESFQDLTTKEMANSISSGIRSANHVANREVIEEFLRDRVKKLEPWDSGDWDTPVEVQEEIRRIPGIETIWTNIQAEKDKDTGEDQDAAGS